MIRPPRAIAEYAFELPVAFIFAVRSLFALTYGPGSQAAPGLLEHAWPVPLFLGWHSLLFVAAVSMFVGMFSRRRHFITGGVGTLGILLLTYGLALVINEINQKAPILTGITYLTVAVVCLLRAWSETYRAKVLSDLVQDHQHGND